MERAEEERHAGGAGSGDAVALSRPGSVHLPAVDVVNERVNDVSEDKGPGSSQAVLHLRQQQADKQVVHEEDAMAFVAVGGLCHSFTHGQQNPLDGDLRHSRRAGKRYTLKESAPC